MLRYIIPSGVARIMVIFHASEIQTTWISLHTFGMYGHAGQKEKIYFNHRIKCLCYDHNWNVAHPFHDHTSNADKVDLHIFSPESLPLSEVPTISSFLSLKDLSVFIRPCVSWKFHLCLAIPYRNYRRTSFLLFYRRVIRCHLWIYQAKDKKDTFFQ